MLRHPIACCLILALWGCNQSTAPSAQSAGAGSSSDLSLSDETSSSNETEKSGETTSEKEAAPAKKAASAKETSAPKEGPISVEAALQQLDDANGKKELLSAAESLEQALEADPENADGLVMMAQLSQFLGVKKLSPESPEAEFHKSAKYLRRAIKAKPDLADHPEFRAFAAAALYRDAATYAREKKLAQSLASLREAVEFGFTDLDRIDKDKQFADIRSSPELAEFKEEAEVKIKELVLKEVSRLLEKNEPFDFDFDLKDIGGNKLSKADLAGHVLIVDIWGTWCGPCRMEIPHFVALSKEYREKGLRIVGLNEESGDDDEEKIQTVKEFVEEEGVDYPCALITESVMRQVPDFEGFPTTLFLDRTGQVRLKVVGVHDMLFLEAAVQALLGEEPGVRSH